MPVTTKLAPTSTLGSYIPTLDGWRAVSIALVLLHHSRISVRIPLLGPLLTQLSNYGRAGVFVFFAISGILICGRLLREEQKNGRIDLRNFYIRRAFRILPPALLYLATIAALSSVLKVKKLELLSSLLFFRNYVLQSMPPPANWFTGHFWSLSVEEQFYLLLPGIFVLFRKNRAWIIGGLAIFVKLLDLAMNHSLLARFDTSIQALLIAALIAIAVSRDRRGTFRRYLVPSSSFALIAISILGIVKLLPLSLTTQGFALALLILSTSLHPASLLGRFLELAPLRWIGRLSYSIYLWQELFLCTRWWDGPLPLGMLQTWPVNLCACLSCAVASYYCIERPLVRLGHRIASSGVPGRAQEG